MNAEIIDTSAQFWMSLPWYRKAYYWLTNTELAMHCSACVSVVKKYGWKGGAK